VKPSEAVAAWLALYVEAANRERDAWDEFDHAFMLSRLSPDDWHSHLSVLRASWLIANEACRALYLNRPKEGAANG
jgi:hypothetical protein